MHDDDPLINSAAGPVGLVGNLAVACATGAGGLWIFAHLGPMLVDWQLAGTNLITLAALHSGLPAALRIILFVLLLLLAGGLIGWAGWCLWRIRRAGLWRLNRMLLVQAILVLALLEAVVRGTGALGLWPANMLTYLANPVCGETYHRLVAQTRPPVAADNYDPDLGWTRPELPDIETGPPDGRPAWFFGDSFMQGVAAGGASPTDVFAEARPRTEPLNFAVGGYGVDQIWLNYERLGTRIPSGATVFVGVLTTDLDRSVLSFFSGFKPVFRRRGDDYVLVPPPPSAAEAQRLTREPVSVGSYAFALMRAFAELIETGFDRSEASCGRTEKARVNTYLMDQIIDHAATREHRLHWVLFVPFPEFYKTRSWRYDFLKAYFNDRAQSYIDTMTVIAEAAEAAGRPPESFYIPVDGHLNADGNRVVGAAMARLFE